MGLVTFRLWKDRFITAPYAGHDATKLQLLFNNGLGRPLFSNEMLFVCPEDGLIKVFLRAFDAEAHTHAAWYVIKRSWQYLTKL